MTSPDGYNHIVVLAGRFQKFPCGEEMHHLELSAFVLIHCAAITCFRGKLFPFHHHPYQSIFSYNHVEASLWISDYGHIYPLQRLHRDANIGRHPLRCLQYRPPPSEPPNYQRLRLRPPPLPSRQIEASEPLSWPKILRHLRLPAPHMADGKLARRQHCRRIR